MKTQSRPLCVLAIAASLALCGCVGFQRDWTRAQKAHPAPHESIEGAWTGSWRSGVNGHNGGLRCVVTRTAPERYEFYYWATWARVLSGGFRIEVDAEHKAGEWRFSGDKDLGKLGGAFSHDGVATPNKLKASYKSERGDHGTFELTRPAGGA